MIDGIRFRQHEGTFSISGGVSKSLDVDFLDDTHRVAANATLADGDGPPNITPARPTKQYKARLSNSFNNFGLENQREKTFCL